MKSIQLKAIIFSVVTLVLSSCTKDSDVTYNAPKNTLFFENFDNSTNVSPFTFNEPNWTTYAQTGTKKWLEKSYKSDGYAAFSSYLTGEPINVTWLISPAINMDTQDGETLTFQSCTDGYVRNLDNSLELFVSTDYDGVNFNNASWQKINCTVAGPSNVKYLYADSGFIDLSSYKGTLHFAFKYSGTTTMSGGYQVDNVRVFY